MYVMDKYDLSSDPCDRRIIRFNNMLQLLACICQLLAIFMPEFQDAAQIISCIADIVFLITAGCMYAQVNYELTQREKSGELAAVGTAGGGQFAAAPKGQPPMDGRSYPPQPPVAAATVVGVPAGQPRMFPVTIPPDAGSKSKDRSRRGCLLRAPRTIPRRGRGVDATQPVVARAIRWWFNAGPTSSPARSCRSRRPTAVPWPSPCRPAPWPASRSWSPTEPARIPPVPAQSPETKLFLTIPT